MLICNVGVIENAPRSLVASTANGGIAFSSPISEHIISRSWGSPDVGVPRVNLRRISLENPANPRYIAAAGGRDKIIASIHHCLLEDGSL